MPRYEGKTGKEPGDLPELTDEEQIFIEAVLAGKNQSEAYRLAYPGKDNWTDASIRVAASRYAKRNNVVLTIRAARESVQDTANVTLERHLAELASIRDLALAANNFGAAVQAESNRAKAGGLITDNVRLTAVEKATDEELVDTIATQMGMTRDEVIERMAKGSTKH